MPIVVPFEASRKFVTNAGQGTGSGASFSIAATSFIDDAGTSAIAFPNRYSYYLLNINGVLQLSSASTVSGNSITIPNGDTLDTNIPIMVEFIVN